MIGSIILIIDPQKNNNKKYLDDKYLDINKKVVVITINSNNTRSNLFNNPIKKAFRKFETLFY